MTTRADTQPPPGAPPGETWLTPGVKGISAASLLADAGHEVPTALLPSLLTATLGAPASALGLIEGISDGLAGLSRFAGGALADDPQRRRSAAIGGYTTTAVLSGLIGVSASVWQVAVLRAGAWAARGLRVPARNALLADVVKPSFYTRAYGVERAADNGGAIIGPLLAIALVALVGVRTAIMLSIIPGLLAVAAILYAIHTTAQPAQRERAPIRIRVRPVLRGQLGRLMAGISVFELGNVAATLLILRATDLLEPSRGQDAAAQQAIALYVAYNIAAMAASLLAGHLGDRRGVVRVLAGGVAAFGLAYAGFAATNASLPALAGCFIAAGIGIGFVETAEHAAVASMAAPDIRGSAFGLLAAVQSLGNLAASAIAGLLYTIASPTAAFVYSAVLMAAALVALLWARTPTLPSTA